MIVQDGTPRSVLRFSNRHSGGFAIFGRTHPHASSHTPHRLQTILTPPQEAVEIVLRKTLLVVIDDLLAVVGEFLNPDVSGSGLDRCLRRNGVGHIRDFQAKDPRPKHRALKAYEPGYLHVDVKYLGPVDV